VNVNFKDRRLTALLEEYEHLTTTENATPIVTAHSRRATRRLASAGAAAIGGRRVVIVTTGTATPLPSHTPRPAGALPLQAATPPPGASRYDVAYVVHGIHQALDANTDFVHELVYAPDGQTGAPTIEETWSRGGTDTTHTIALNSQGRPTSGTLVTITAHKTTSISIDYARQSYTERTYPFGSDTTGPGPEPATPTGQAATLRARRRRTGDARGTDDSQRPAGDRNTRHEQQVRRD
jgi:hypothetical protein